MSHYKINAGSRWMNVIF